MSVAVGGSVSTRQTVLWVVLLAPVAVVLTVVLACTDHAMLLVNDRASTVRFGVPFDWLTQGSWLSPPDHLMPYELSPMSPWEFPTTVALGPFAADVVIVYALLLGALVVTRLAMRRFRRSDG